MKKMLLLGLCLWSVLLVKGQTPVNMVFTYDYNGNRTGREICFIRGDGGLENTEAKQELLPFVSDCLGVVEVSIYPNPTNDKVYVAASGIGDGQNMKAVLSSMSGETLEERTIANTRESFDLSGKASGVYLLELYMNQEKHIWKVIKK